MVKFEGQTGPYLQYSIVRIFSMLKNVNLNFDLVNYQIYTNDVYFNLVQLIDQFPVVLERAQNENSPSVIARYLLQLAQEFNSFYGKVRILADDQNLLQSNIYLVTAIQTVLIEGLRLLGIGYLEAM